MGRYTYNVAVEMKEPETPPLPFNNPLLISRSWSRTILSKLHALSQLLSPWLPMLIPSCWCLCCALLHRHGCGGGTLIQACHCLSMLEVDPHGQLSMVVVGAHCVSWWLWEERGRNVWHCVPHLTPLGCVKWHCSYFHPWHQVEDGAYPLFGSVPLNVYPCC